MEETVKIMQDTIVVSFLKDSETALPIVSADGWFSWSLSLGEVLAILCAVAGVLVAVYQYKKSSEASRVQALKNQKETWFLNVIVLPQLERIDEFYQEVLKNLSADKQSIEKWAKGSHDTFVINTASLKKQRKDEINEFLENISTLVKSYDSALGKKVDKVIMDLEDKYVNIIDAYNTNEAVNEREVVFGNKLKLIKLLNSAMAK